MPQYRSFDTPYMALMCSLYIYFKSIFELCLCVGGGRERGEGRGEKGKGEGGQVEG